MHFSVAAKPQEQKHFYFDTTLLKNMRYLEVKNNEIFRDNTSCNKIKSDTYSFSVRNISFTVSWKCLTAVR